MLLASEAESVGLFVPDSESAFLLLLASFSRDTFPFDSVPSTGSTGDLQHSENDGEFQ